VVCRGSRLEDKGPATIKGQSHLVINPQEFGDSHPAWFAVIFSAYFVCLWCRVAAVISLTGGWFQPSRKYRRVRPFDGVSDGLRSGRMRWFTHSRNCLRLGANEDGLYLAISFLFRFMHAPLFVSWNEIEVCRKKRWLFGEYVTFTLGNEPKIPLRISGASAIMLRDGAGTHWPRELP
jgi:hypothetical protein